MYMKETHQQTKPGFINGQKVHQRLAYQALPILVRQAKGQQPLYYSLLQSELGMGSPRPLRYVLGAIGNELLKLSHKWLSSIPPIQFLVINKTTGLPGKGVSPFAPDPAIFRSSGPSDKRRILDALLHEIFAFSRWDEVLTDLGLRPLAPASSSLPSVEQIAATDHYCSGGESNEHKMLKEHLAKHPEIVGLPRGSTGTLEHEFESADLIDVLFTHRSEWVGVEVKSVISAEADIIRGLFQCVKYQALMEAQQRYRGLPLHCRVVLVLGGELPEKLLPLKHLLGVTVIEGLGKPI